MKTSFDLIDLFYISPIIVLFLVSLVPILSKVLNGNKEPSSFFSVFIPVCGGLAAAVLSVGASLYIMGDPNIKSSPLAFSGALIMDGIALWTSFLVSIILCVIILISKENPYTKGKQFSEYIFLLVNSAVGMMIVAWSNDLIVTFIGIEVMSLCLYILIALSNETRHSKEASIKYFILGSFASAIFLYGIALMYGTIGTTYIHEIVQGAREIISINRVFLIGTGMVALGFAFKVSLFPFFNWTPDVYQGSGTPLTTFMATGVKVVSFVAFLRFMTTDILGGVHSEAFITTLQWMAVLTIIVGNVAAILQDDLKRILAYSSVAHSGYLLIGVIVAGADGGQSIGASGVVFYLFAYAIMTLGAFAVVSVLEKDTDTPIKVDDLKGMSSRHPLLALAMCVFMLSLAGIPPTLGFFGKFYLFSAAIAEGFFWLAVWGVVGSVISVYYYLRPLVVMYMSDEAGAGIVDRTPATRFAIVIMALLVILIGLASEPFYMQMQASVLSLY
ncbi:MAG: NADH-quinone oxidoreductase subunit N [Bdellovibrionaceae bacterium]|nr:NADH-quinone oxidoreductase subunit N [Pseudobdellovibrionaceae bacterium]|tara:strand:+ start:159363 stop:160865 length:1503 start_codon:yes stop_codon:yes gene_type:complete